MKPETKTFLAKAREWPDRAPALLAQNFTDAIAAARKSVAAIVALIPNPPTSP